MATACAAARTGFRQRRQGGWAAELLAAALAILLSGGLAVGQRTTTTRPASHPATHPAAQAGPVGPHAPVVTHHTITVNAQPLRYTATVGFLDIRDDAGKIQAYVFYTAYVKDGQNPATRPVMFAFNGGPGAASMWLHLGLGPRRLVLPDEGKAMPRTIHLVDNQYTWLAFTDLVFLDPIGSGYSHPAPGVDPKAFYGLEGDVRSVGQAIDAYVTQAGRWASPKYLAGESYGTTRGAGLAEYLPRHYGMDLSGLVMLSSALDFQTFTFSRAKDLPCELYLPSYTAVAWYHHRLPEELQSQELADVLAAAERWAVSDYGPALARGDGLPEADRRRIIDGLHRYTGLPQDYLRRADLRVTPQRFAAELLRDRGEVVGILDARVTGYAPDPLAGRPREDPAMYLVSGPYAAAIQAYMRDELGVTPERPYVYLSTRANEEWNWGSAGGGPVDVSDDLQAAMTANSNLTVFVGMGYFDLTTGYFTQRYTYSHLGLPAPLRGRLTEETYLSGHQIYTYLPALKELTADVARFVKGAP